MKFIGAGLAMVYASVGWWWCGGDLDTIAAGLLGSGLSTICYGLGRYDESRRSEWRHDR